MTEPPDRRPTLRASDADRALVHDILAAAMSQGHISPTEYETRATQAVAARTFGELDQLTDDLPVADIARAGGPSTTSPLSMTKNVAPSGRSPVTTKVAVMSGAELTGDVPVGDRLQAFAIMGGVEIDLRAVEFTATELHIDAYAIMGGVDIVVPHDAEVDVRGVGFMGGFPHSASGSGRPGVPRIVVTGLALMGGVDVKRADKS